MSVPLAPARVSNWVIAAAAFVVLLWASAFVAVKLALTDVTPGQLALARYLVASLAFALLLLVRRPVVPRVQDLFRLALVGGVGISLYNLALNTGQQTVGAGVASLLVNTVPIWTSLLSVVLLRERIGWAGWLGTAVSFVGVAIIGLQKSRWGGFELGVLMIIGAALSQALYFVIARPLLQRYHPIDLTSYAVWFGCLFLVPFHTGLWDAVKHSSSTTVGAIVFLGVGPAALAYLAWSYVLAALPAGKASQALFLVPVAAIALGWMVLGEVPGIVVLLGGGLSIFGVMLAKGVFT